MESWLGFSADTAESLTGTFCAPGALTASRETRVSRDAPVALGAPNVLGSSCGVSTCVGTVLA